MAGYGRELRVRNGRAYLLRRRWALLLAAAAFVACGARGSLAAGTCTASALAGYSCVYSPDASVDVHWNASTAGVAFAVQSAAAGWVGLGFSRNGKMDNADAVIYGTYSAGAAAAPTVGAYTLTGPNAALAASTTSYSVTPASAAASNGNVTFKFFRSFEDGAVPLVSSGTNTLIWAYSNTAYAFNPNGHSQQGSFQIDFTEKPAAAASNDSSSASNATSGSGTCTASNLAGYNCSASAGGGKFVLHWRLNSSTSVDLAVVAATTGWVSLGWSSNGKMAPSDAVVAFSGASPSVAAYQISSYTASSIVQSNSLFALTGTSVSANASSGSTVVKFTRAYNTGSVKFTAGTATTLIWAVSPDNSNTIEYHGSNRGSMTIDFATGSSSVAAAGGGARDAYRKAHVVLMYVAFAALFPAAVFIARFGQSPKLTPLWFHLHLTSTISAVVIATVGFILAVVKLGSMGSAHAQLGVALMALVWVQGPLGAVRPHKAARTRPFWYAVHWLIGTSVVVLGFVDTGLGIALYRRLVLGSVYAAWYASLGLEAGLLLALYALLEFLRLRRSRSVAAASTPPGAPGSMVNGLPPGGQVGLVPAKATDTYYTGREQP